jgi:Tol biopolymer transport system component
MVRQALLPIFLTLSCATLPPPPSQPREEVHFSELRQLTSGGENAEAYWSFDGQKLSFQRRMEGEACDRIYTLQPFAARPEARRVSSGLGATTCAHFFPGGDELLYASTHLGGESCPPKPDMSQGYVWALYDTYDIFKARADGTGVTRLTETPGYDAEATVCGKDGSIVFTSVRDGDLELYRMDKDGGNVKRLTFEPGYDGGAFFNADCTKLVWRASRPKPGKALEDYKALLTQGKVRPSKLELWVANADGSEARQVTYLDAASFAPFWFPGKDRILFSSNYGDPKGREFDLWAVDADGTDLERITFTQGFDGFPMFSPDGKHLVFASNRATAEGRTDTNLFLATWVDAAPQAAQAGAAERIQSDVTWLAAPEREGRGVGTQGLDAAGQWLEERFRGLGLEPLGEGSTYRHTFQVTTKVSARPSTRLLLAGQAVAADLFTAPGWSGQGTAKGQAVLVGHGLQDTALGLDDYAGRDVKGKVAVALRFAPEHEKLQTPEAQRRAGDLRKKAFVARAQGATALLVVDWPMPVSPPKDFQLPPEAPLPTMRPEGLGDAGIPVVLVKRAALEPVMRRLIDRQPVDIDLTVELAFEKTPAFNVVGRLPAKTQPSEAPLIIGAHYDHLGQGGPHSLTPDRREPHVGADDNASGTAALLEVARLLSEQRESLRRDVVLVAFSGEEEGLLGSSSLVQSQPTWMQGAVAMLNMDMVGRLRMNQLAVLGSDSAPEWPGLVQAACDKARVSCKVGGDGYGPSDHMAFYTAGMPVLHFFTGPHSDYHKPSDTPEKLNAVGVARVALVVADLALTAQRTKLTYQKLSAPPTRGDARSFGASLGTVPDYGAATPGVKGLKLADVRPGGGAEKGGMRRGDILLRLGQHEIGSVEDLMFVLQQARPGETVRALVLREGKEVALEVTFQEARRH